jgi:hypothetical protein
MEHNEQRIDSLLDVALHRYGAVEPRPGLEGRILVGVQGPTERSAMGWAWWPIIATVAVALVVGAVRWEEPIASPVTAATGELAPPAMWAQKNGAASQRAARHLPRRGIREFPMQAARTDVSKHEQFPSPAPLSEQEQMLACYVAEHHERAVLVARAQAEVFRAEEQASHQRDQERSDPTTR